MFNFTLQRRAIMWHPLKDPTALYIYFIYKELWGFLLSYIKVCYCHTVKKPLSYSFHPKVHV